jgi:hypothetical protein
VAPGWTSPTPTTPHACSICPPETRFDELLGYPEGGKKGKSLGQAVDDAMSGVERDKTIAQNVV